MTNLRVIQTAGILDGLSGGNLRHRVDDTLKAGSKLILVDCTAVEFMDSSGLGALVMALKQTKSVGGRLALCGINDQIKMLLELTDMDSAFEIFANREAFEQVI
jgi:anti-sigma B factor antagonist